MSSTVALPVLGADPARSECPCLAERSEAGTGHSYGLVEPATSHASHPEIAVSGPDLGRLLWELGHKRRLSRMRRTVLRFVDEARDGLTRGGFRPPQLVMVTLTYRNLGDWKARHISDFLLRVTQWLERRSVPYAYAWTLEMQERGAPHYHVLFWLPHDLRLPKPDQRGPRQRRPFWSFGMTNIKAARSPGYIVKYATKGHDVRFPPHARLFGVGASVRRWRQVARWAALPVWLRDVSEPGDRFVRRSGGGWVSLETGQYFESPWAFSIERTNGVFTIRLKRKCGPDPAAALS